MAPTDYAQHAIEHMKRQTAIEVFNEIYKAGHAVVVETHLEEWEDFTSYTKRYTLHCRLTAVQHRHFVIPVFEFENHEGRKEWKCPACGIVNTDVASYCGEL